MENNTNKLHVEVEINCALEKTWDGFVNPDHIVNWYFASDDWCAPSAVNNLTVGETFTIRMEAKDGSFGFDMGGVYTEIDAMNSFTYKMADGRMVIVKFKQINESTVLVSEDFDPENQNPLEMQQAGWQMILNNFKKYIESV